MDYKLRYLILEYLEKKNTASIHDLASLCEITLPTIRKYLKILHNENIILFQRGQANKLTNHYNTILGWRIDNYKNSKQLIGKYAASLVEEHDTIFIGGGSTVLYMVDYLVHIPNLSIVTNSIQIINKVVNFSNINLTCIGGKWDSGTSSFIGNISDDLQKFIPDKVFIGAMAIDLKRGITHQNNINNLYEFSMYHKGKQSFILADSSKFDLDYSWIIIETVNIRNIITDKKFSKKKYLLWKESGISVLSCLENDSQ